MTYRRHYEQVLGTACELRIGAGTAEQAQAAEQAALAEIDRLEMVYSRFLPDSELNRWLRGGAATGALCTHVPGPDLAWMLAVGEQWRLATGNAFHPGADALGELWRAAAAQDRVPGDEELAPVVRALNSEPPLPGALNFNALAKGRIIDRACLEAAGQPGVSDVLVNIGGDLRCTGPTDVRVQIAHPGTRADNAAPEATLCLRGLAVATSGGTHRGFRVAEEGRERLYSHLLDPRTGRSVQHVLAASVIAGDCASADALATALSVLPADEGLRLANSFTQTGCLIVEASGRRRSNAFWQAHCV
ncbi:FAD:protein FMN transferase [Deinococcus sp. UYEF24]